MHLTNQDTFPPIFALLEGFFVTSSDCHVTGFASQVTSVCYLDVRLDDDFGQSDDDDDHLHGNHPLLTLTHGNLGDRQTSDKGKIITKVHTNLHIHCYSQGIQYG